MKKFAFRLERVLRFRETERKDRERELAVKNYELFEAEDQLQTIVSEHDRVPAPAENIYSMAELSLSGNYQQLLQEALINQRLLVIEATSAVEDARDAYIEKAIEAEILDTLKGRRKDEHKDEVRLDEQKELDEIAVSRHRFKSKGSNGGNEGEDNGEG